MILNPPIQHPQQVQHPPKCHITPFFSLSFNSRPLWEKPWAITYCQISRTQPSAFNLLHTNMLCFGFPLHWMLCWTLHVLWRAKRFAIRAVDAVNVTIKILEMWVTALWHVAALQGRQAEREIKFSGSDSTPWQVRCGGTTSRMEFLIQSALWLPTDEQQQTERDTRDLRNEVLQTTGQQLLSINKVLLCHKTPWSQSPLTQCQPTG